MPLAMVLSVIWPLSSFAFLFRLLQKKKKTARARSRRMSAAAIEPKITAKSLISSSSWDSSETGITGTGQAK